MIEFCSSKKERGSTFHGVKQGNCRNKGSIIYLVVNGRVDRWEKKSIKPCKHKKCLYNSVKAFTLAIDFEVQGRNAGKISIGFSQ